MVKAGFQRERDRNHFSETTSNGDEEKKKKKNRGGGREGKGNRTAH